MSETFQWQTDKTDVPVTRNGIYIHLRNVTIQTNTSEKTLLKYLETFYQTLPKTYPELLKNFKPSINLLHIDHPTHPYLIVLQNVSSKQTRIHFAQIFQKIIDNQEALAIHLDWITGGKQNLAWDPAIPEIPPLVDLIVNPHLNQEYAQYPPTHVHPPFHLIARKLLTEEIPKISPIKRPLTPLSPEKEPDLLQKALNEAQINLEESPTHPNEPPQKRAKHVPTLYKGLPTDRTKWTAADWQRIKLINNWKKNNTGPSSSEKNQEQEQDDHQTSQSQNTQKQEDQTDTGTSHSPAVKKTLQELEALSSDSSKFPPAKKHNLSVLHNLLTVSSDGFATLLDTEFNGSHIMVLSIPLSIYNKRKMYKLFY